MAQLFPSPHLPHVRMTAGERRLAARLLGKLENDYLCWFNVPIGPRQLKPDYIVLHPARGILVLEVKDWLLSTLQSVDRQSATLLTERGLVTQINPLEQARQYAQEIVHLLQRDPLLVADDGRYRGQLLTPWGYGVVLSRITRRQFLAAGLDQAIDENRVICQDEMVEDVDAEAFQVRLWGMFNYCYGSVLSLACVDRIRWYLFPEVRVQPVTAELFDDEPKDAAKFLPDLVKVMDLQQEQLARNLGEGHRVVHGVAGSGKTLILAYRCLHLSEAGHGKPILVLCYNRTLAARLEQILRLRGAGDAVHIYNFHRWCQQQLDLYQVDVPAATDPETRYKQMVEALIAAVDTGRVPRAQYAAILIDEGHDFEPEWFRLVVQMVDPETNALLLLYDDVQSIYARRRAFSWASVGVQAQGRTTILKINYRNTVQLLQFAYRFVQDYLDEVKADEEIPVVAPNCAGRQGPPPLVLKCASADDEIVRIAAWLRERHASAGVPYGEMAVLYRARYQGERLKAGLERLGFEVDWLTQSRRSRDFKPSLAKVKLITMHSSKGLEFNSVAIANLCAMPLAKADPAQEAKLLYVAMTRATEALLLTGAKEERFFAKLLATQDAA